MAQTERLSQLLQTLTDHFSDDELRTLCFKLGVDYEDLPGQSRAAKARELVAYCERHDRVVDLEEECRKTLASHTPTFRTAMPLPGDPVPLPRATGSPFVVGRPLRPEEPIFGREDAFHYIARELAQFSSVNLVGERRIGKTSLLNHLAGHQDQYLAPQPDQPPLVLACLNFQDRVSNEARFYGAALRELLAHLPSSRSVEAREFASLRERLSAKPESSHDEFERVLKQLRDARGISARPALVVDEFEHLLEPSVSDGFPFPDFYNGLRALMSDGLLAMVVASRRLLSAYFTDPARPQSMTSTFPTYFTPYTLTMLDDAAADALLLQPSDHPLTITEAAEARRWAGGHPCHLQAAGKAWYEAKAEGHAPKWAYQRFLELKSQNCMVSPMTSAKPAKRPGWLLRALKVIFVDMPIGIGRLAQRLGAKIDDMAAWIIGVVLIIVLVLVLVGVASGTDVLQVLKKGLGLTP
jgi:uncharacterized protein